MEKTMRKNNLKIQMLTGNPVNSWFSAGSQISSTLTKMLFYILDSCKGRCWQGPNFKLDKRHCDSLCKARDDCCDDFDRLCPAEHCADNCAYQKCKPANNLKSPKNQHQLSKSCRDRCWADHDPNNRCNCNADCDETYDCCYDFKDYCPTDRCMHRCFHPFNPKAECQCNHDCKPDATDVQRCCKDFTNICSDKSCAGRCSFFYDNQFQCQCSPDCKKKGNCCHDFKERCADMFCYGNCVSDCRNATMKSPMNASMNGLEFN